MLGKLCAVAAALTWSFSVVLFKRSEAASPQSLNLFKNVSASLLMFATLPILGVGINTHRSATDWVFLIVSGFLGIAVADTLVFIALRKLGAALLAVVDCIYAPVIVVLSVLVLDESLTWGFLVGAILVVGGVVTATVSLNRRDGPRLAMTPNVKSGIAYGIAGIVAMALGVVLAKPVLEEGHLVEVSFIRLASGVLGQLLWMLVVPSQRSALAVLKPSKVWVTLLPASVLGSYVAMLFWLGGFKWASASTASVLNQLSSVFTLILARFLLKEPVSTRRAVGAVAAVMGAMVILI